MINKFAELSHIHMLGIVIQDKNDWLLNPLGFYHGRKIANQSFKILALLNLFGAPATRVRSFESAVSSVLTRRTPGRLIESKTRRTNGRHLRPVEVGPDLLHPRVPSDFNDMRRES